jgi:hypothetical protein
MDGDAAFFRCATHEDIIGMQCARIRNITVVLLCCSFGWKRSAEVFSHITAGIKAAHESDLGSASLLADGYQPKTHVPGPNQQFAPPG